MKKILVLIAGIILLWSCTPKPTIEEVEDFTRADAESLLTEANKEDLYLRMDRYFLYDDSEDLTYKGYLRATAFYNIRYGSTIVRSDSLKVSYDVCVKFMDKRYKSYMIQLERIK